MLSLALLIGPHATGIRAIVGAVSIKSIANLAVKCPLWVDASIKSATSSERQ